MSRSRYRFGEEPFPYFLTDTVVAWLPIFSHPDFANVVLDSWRFLQRERNVKIFAWVIMENHIHWVAAGPSIGKRVAQFKSFTATQILEKLKRRGFKTLLQELQFFKKRNKVTQDYQLWQEGSHPQSIECTHVLRQKIEYIHDNPVRRGYVDDPVHWRYSSARSYAGHDGLLDVYRDWL